MSKKTATVPIRVDEALRAKLEAAAVKDRRPFAAYVRNLLQDAVSNTEARAA